MPPRSDIPPKIAFLPFPKPCAVCGKPTNVQHHKIAYSHFKKGRAKGNPNRRTNVVPLCSLPQYAESCHSIYDSVVGQHPYMGSDRTKRMELAKNVAKLLALDERFERACAGYMLKAYAEFKRGELT